MKELDVELPNSYAAAKTPDRAGASERAGDQGRTGDVQLGNQIDQEPEDYDPWA